MKGAITPETPCNFSYHIKYDVNRDDTPTWIVIGRDCHLVRLLWLYLAGRLRVTVVWIGPIVGVTLGPDSEVSVWVLGTQCLGIAQGQGL